MTIGITLAQENVLQALESIGGWATVKGLAKKSGYSGDWTNRTVNSLVDTGVLQKSSLSPYLYSLVGKDLCPPISDTKVNEPEVLKRLANAAAHTVGRTTFLETYLTGSTSMLVSLRSVLQMADLAGYDVVLVKKK